MHQKKGYLEAYFANILEKLDLEYKQKHSVVREPKGDYCGRSGILFPK
jgi:hypothetical protein